MKVGDLVTLSAYGKKLLLLFCARDRVGLLIEFETVFVGSWTVLWPGDTQPFEHGRKHLKKA